MLSTVFTVTSLADSFANDDPGLWCSGATAIGAGPDMGTPGAPNDVCP